jgi:hypothetical protein
LFVGSWPLYHLLALFVRIALSDAKLRLAFIYIVFSGVTIHLAFIYIAFLWRNDPFSFISPFLAQQSI